MPKNTETPTSATRRKVIFNPEVKIKTIQSRNHQNVTFRSTEPYFPNLTLTDDQKRELIVQSSRDSTKRLTYGMGPSRATKHDIKRSEEAHLKLSTETPQSLSSTSTLHELSKQPSPLLDLVRGATKRTKESKAKAEVKKQSGMKALVDVSLKLFFSRETLKTQSFQL